VHWKKEVHHIEGPAGTQNKAIGAALGRSLKDRRTAEELFHQTGQPSVKEVSLQAVMTTAKLHLGCEASDIASGCICEQSHNNTRP
jgi:hypothetical protein